MPRRFRAALAVAAGLLLALPGLGHAQVQRTGVAARHTHGQTFITWSERADLPAATYRVYISGHSMGGSGALAFALRYPHVFAAAYASKPMTNYREGGGWKGSVSAKWGSEAANLPIMHQGPATWIAPLRAYDGTGVWDWQNHQAALAMRRGDDFVPFALTQGICDTSIVWSTQGEPLYPTLGPSAKTGLSPLPTTTTTGATIAACSPPSPCKMVCP